MVVELFDELDRDNPFYDLCQAIKRFVGQVDEAGHSLTVRRDIKNWTEQELPPFTEYNLIRSADEYRESHSRNRDSLRFEFGRFAEPDAELEQLLSLLEFRSFPHSFETAQNVFDAERSIEKDLKPAYPIWRKLAVRLDGLILGFFRGDHSKGRTFAVIVSEEFPSAGNNVKIHGTEHRIDKPTWRVLKLLQSARTAKHDRDEGSGRLLLSELTGPKGDRDASKKLTEFERRYQENYPNGLTLIDRPNGVKGAGYALN